jgi:hypothetical protein
MFTLYHTVAKQKFYATRAMRSDFVNKYYRINKQFFVTYSGPWWKISSASNCAAEENVDDNVARALSNLGDPGMILDLCS